MTLRDEVAALQAERDLLRAQLAKRRYPKKPYEEMTAEEYRRRLGRTPRPVAPPISTSSIGMATRLPPWDHDEPPP